VGEPESGRWESGRVGEWEMGDWGSGGVGDVDGKSSFFLLPSSFYFFIE